MMNLFSNINNFLRTNTPRLPTKEHPRSSIYLIYAPDEFVLRKKARHLMQTGVKINLPEGYSAMILPVARNSFMGIDVKVTHLEHHYNGNYLI
jgi:dUTPase